MTKFKIVNHRNTFRRNKTNRKKEKEVNKLLKEIRYKIRRYKHIR